MEKSKDPSKWLFYFSVFICLFAAGQPLEGRIMAATSPFSRRFMECLTSKRRLLALDYWRSVSSVPCWKDYRSGRFLFSSFSLVRGSARPRPLTAVAPIGRPFNRK